MTAPATPNAAPTPVLAPNWWLGVLEPKYWPLRKIPFSYEVDFLPLLIQAAPQQQSAPIQNDSDFVCLSLQALITTTANPPGLLWGSGFTNNAPSQVLVQIADQSTQQNLQQTTVPLDNLAGSGPFPAPLPWPYTFAKSGAIQVNAINLNNAQMQVRLTFSGIRIFY